MKLCQILEGSKSHRLVVVYGGRFQPFHKGHYHAYQWLCKKFGEENVWIATSNKTNFNPNAGEVSPFTYKEKKEIITSLYNVNPRRIVMCKNPAFSPEEIFDAYGDFDVTYVSAVGKKDIERYKTGTFFRPLPSPFSLKDLDMLATRDEKVGYYIEIPMQFKDLSGTIVREELSKARGDDRETAFKKYFGKYDSMVDALVTAKLKEVKAPKEKEE
jgi:cytidyltransferase-like protein